MQEVQRRTERHAGGFSKDERCRTREFEFG
jgi:hypothetical protein